RESRGDMIMEQLFTRRQFLGASAAIAVGSTVRADDAAPVTFGEGSASFALDPNWGRLPEGMKYGYGCAIVVDSRDRIIVTSRSANPCVAIFDAAGKLLETWTKELSDRVGYSVEQIKDTAHGLFLNREDDGEYLYWTENVRTT